MPINSFLYPGAKVTPAYEVDNSVRIEYSDRYQCFTRTLGTPTDRKKFTISCWLKIGDDVLTANTEKTIFGAGSDYAGLHLDGSSDPALAFQIDNSDTHQIVSTQVFRDPSAWYHVVAVYDSAQSTNTNRAKLYVNGAQITALDTSNYPDQNYEGDLNSAIEHRIGAHPLSSSRHWDGYIAEFVFVDGQALDPTSFGEFDSDSPTIWKPKNVSGLTLGNNGCYLDFEDSSNLGNDAGGGTDWTETNIAAINQSTDTPTNNYATFNPLDNLNSQFTFSEGNLTGAYSGSNGSGTGTTATFGLSQGKWYWEVKYDSANDSPLRIGITNRIAVGTGTTYRVGFGGDDFAFDQGDGKVYTDNEGGDTASYGSGFSVGDIIGVALDLDNNRIYWSVNGTYENSGNPAGNSNGFAITDPASIDNGFYFPVVSLISGSGVAQVSYNFGSPPFAISSGNSDANGYGNFEYAVPSGFYAINSKNLAEFG